jgi:hypothetical protein
LKEARAKLNAANAAGKHTAKLRAQHAAALVDLQRVQAANARMGINRNRGNPSAKTPAQKLADRRQRDRERRKAARTNPQTKDAIREARKLYNKEYRDRKKAEKAAGKVSKKNGGDNGVNIDNAHAVMPFHMIPDELPKGFMRQKPPPKSPAVAPASRLVASGLPADERQARFVLVHELISFLRGE